MKVVVVEDQPLMRDVLSRICISELGCTVVAATGSAAAAITEIRLHRPDMILLDLVLTEGSGFDVIRGTSATCVSHKIMVLSAYCDAYSVWRLSRLKIDAFIAKEESTVGSLKEAFSQVSRGERYFSQAFHSVRLRLLTDPKSFQKLLTTAEVRILGLVGSGLDDNEIGAHLAIAPRTAQTHRGNISRKLNIHTSAKLMSYAIACGLHRFGGGRETAVDTCSDKLGGNPGRD